jgi:hypothetical protein
MDDPDQVAKRARVLWDKARNMYGSFFVEISAMRDRLGDDDAFDEWMHRKVGVSLGVAIRISNVLREADARRVHEDLKTHAAVVQCLSCGGPMIGRRSTRRYCSDRCRKRAQRWRA